MIKKALLCLIFIFSLMGGGGCVNFISPESAGIPKATPTNEGFSNLSHGSEIQETRTASASLISNMIADIIAHPDQYSGQQVEVIGYYRGWDLLKEVQGTPPVTRSDWVIADNSGAIYVTGSAPEILDPASTQDTRRVIRLTATVEQNQNGVYLRGISVEIISTE